MTPPLTPAELDDINSRCACVFEYDIPALLATVAHLTRRLAAAERVVEAARKVAHGKGWTTRLVDGSLLNELDAYDAARKETT